MVQQKKTDPYPVQELPDLTAKQHAYVMARLAGKTQAEAFREAYDAANSTDRTVWSNAWKTEHNPKVRKWLDVIRLERATAAGYTHDQYMKELEEVRQIAINSGNIGAAVNATVAKGKTAGHTPDLVKEISQPANSAQAVATFANIFGNELAYRLAVEKMGYSHDETVKMLNMTPRDIKMALASSDRTDNVASKELH